MPVIAATVFGAIAGSFLSVVADRLPRSQSLIAPGSHCPGCGTAIRARDNVPLLGWLWLRGRCRACRAAISVRYPLIEAATAALCAAIVLTKSGAVAVALAVALLVVLVPIALIDLDHRMIPNAITAPAALLAVVLGCALDPSHEPARLLAGVAAALFLLLPALARPGAMGLGDVKLAGVLGLYLGPAVAPAILLALIAGVVAGGVIATRVGIRKARKTAVPFGPFLALGAVVAIFAGPALVAAYVRMV